jgi:O-acetyl-ADP-ribose deacetylase (regulator of RNase III)
MMICKFVWIAIFLKILGLLMLLMKLIKKEIFMNFQKLFLTVAVIFCTHLIYSGSVSWFSISGKSTQIVVQRGDIIQCKCDVIVNAANEQLAAGGGVCGAIFEAAGKEKLQKACDTYPILKSTSNVRCHTGHAKLTDSFNLKNKGIKYIVHAVGPDCRIIKNTDQQNELLKSAYLNSLELIQNLPVKSIAFPFISSSIYACPREQAAHVAVKTVYDYIQNSSTSLKSIHFVLFSEGDYQLFCDTASKIMHISISQPSWLESFIQKIKMMFNY